MRPGQVHELELTQYVTPCQLIFTDTFPDSKSMIQREDTVHAPIARTVFAYLFRSGFLMFGPT